MRTIFLNTPLSESEIRDLRVGDLVYLSGKLITARDDVHHRLLKQHKPLPISLRDLAILHAGPIVRRTADGRSYEMVSVGPTTSMRMERLEAEFIAETGLRLIVGKGGMGEKTARACRTYGAVHCVFPGGCAVLAADCVREITGVEWLELGIPEAMWQLRVERFGPLIVSIDSLGNNLFVQNRRIFENRKEAALVRLSPEVDYLD